MRSFFSQLMVNNCNDSDNLPCLLPEDSFSDPRKDLQNSMPEATGVTISTPTLIHSALEKIMFCPPKDGVSHCHVQVAACCEARCTLARYIRAFGQGVLSMRVVSTVHPTGVRQKGMDVLAF